MVKQSLILVCVLIITFVAVSQALCPKCLCPIDFKPVCSQQKTSGKYRGFNSPCVLNCTNQCAKNKYTFIGNGRCGAVRKRIEEEKKRQASTTTTSSSTTTTTSTPKIPHTTKNINSIPSLSI